MYTLGQWKDIRRVDHLSLPAVSFSKGFYIAHPRWREYDPALRPDLKVFDVMVDSYNQANNNFDRVTQLANIIATGSPLINIHINDRYGQAATLLYNQAILDLNGICGAHFQQAIEHFITGVSRPARTVRINVILIKSNGNPAPQQDLNTITNHIQIANALGSYQAAQLNLQQVGGIMQVHQNPQGAGFLLTQAMGAPNNMWGLFQDSAGCGDRLIDYCNTLPRNADVDVVYVPGYDQNDVQGRTFRATVGQNGHIPLRPIVTVRLTPAMGGGATFSTTLAHEMGHALCTEPAHCADPNDLMTAGHNRNGNNNLTLGEMAWFCNNNYVH